MAENDGKEERPQWGYDRPNPGSSAPDRLASGGLSLEDFRQDAVLKSLEARAASLDLPAGTTDPAALDREARQNFRRHHAREKDRADNLDRQTVTDGNGRRVGGRDAWNKPLGDAFPCDGAELFGSIRRENTRHPKRTSPNRPQTPLRQLIEQIVDDGLVRQFLNELTRTVKGRALQDAGLVRHYCLILHEAGFDVETMRPVREVDDDLMLKSGDNKRIAELLTDYDIPTSVRDIENSKRRLDRILLSVGKRVLRQTAPGNGSKE